MEDNQNIKVVLLDIYETMIDMTEIEKRVNHLLDSKRGYLIWFELFMQYTFVENCTVRFNDFPSIGHATFKMAGTLLNTYVREEDIQDALELMKHLPLKEGVQEGLSCLHDKGFRIAALTNSAEEMVRTRMERTGLVSYFEKVLSAEHVKKYKPCIEVYEWAAEQMNAALNEVLMVSAHGWDISGAANAGMQTAYIKQPRQMLYPLAPKPGYIANNLEALAGQLPASK
jgi:2-haloacid dehalogenase